MTFKIISIILLLLALVGTASIFRCPTKEDYISRMFPYMINAFATDYRGIAHQKDVFGIAAFIAFMLDIISLSYITYNLRYLFIPCLIALSLSAIHEYYYMRQVCKIAESLETSICELKKVEPAFSKTYYALVVEKAFFLGLILTVCYTLFF